MSSLVISREQILADIARRDADTAATQPTPPPARPPASARAPAEWALVVAAQAGDSDAFARLYVMHRRLVAGLARHRTRDPETAKDLAADTWLKAWRAIGTLRDPDHSIAAWLTVIVERLAIDYWRRTARRTHPTALLALAVDDVTDPPDVEVCDRVDAGAIRRLVDALPAHQRRLVQLRYWDNLPVAHTGAVLAAEGHITGVDHRQAARSLQYRTIATLRARLEAAA